MRIRGAISTSNNYEVYMPRPFDARMLVQYNSDLYAAVSWRENSIYTGMLVSVAQDPEPSNNGLYILKDVTNYLMETSWVKLFDEEEFEVFQNQLREELSNYVTQEQVAEFAKIAVGALPSSGEANTIYFTLLDGNWEEYIWYNDSFVMIGSNAGDLSNYYTKQEIDEKIASLEAQIPDVSDFVTSQDLQDQLADYATTVDLQSKQDTLISGTNIKTINGQSILGSGNIEIQGGTGTTVPLAQPDVIGGFYSVDNSADEGTQVFVGVDSNGHANVKVPEMSAADIIDTLNDSSEDVILNGGSSAS